jgi:hypothetical protein
MLQAVSGDTSLIERGPIQPKSLEHDIGKRAQELNKLTMKFKLGVAFLDILKVKDRLIFGRYNDRPENRSETSKIIESFKQYGIQPFKDETAIPIILSSSRITSNLSSSFTQNDDLNELHLADEDGIIVASGQHRISALTRYIDEITESKEASEARLEEITTKGVITAEEVEECQVERKKIGEYMWILQDVHKWGVIVYDGEQLYSFVLLYFSMIHDVVRNVSLMLRTMSP